MAELYADENVARELVDALCVLGHDVLTALADGRANQKIGDADLLSRAISLGRAVLTNDRNDYRKLHRAVPGHAGIITYTDAPNDRTGLARRIDAAIAVGPSLDGRLIRVNLPSHPPPSP